MSESLVEVTVKQKCAHLYERTWIIKGENISALTNFLDWAEKQRMLEAKRKEISRRVRVKKGGQRNDTVYYVS